MPSPKFKILDDRTVVSGQSVIKKTTCEFDGKKVLFTLKNDFYQAQCAAVAQVWRPDHLDWSKVVSLVPEGLAMKHGASYLPGDRKTDPSVFAADMDELQRMTAMILG
jgi:hypothetical protein